MTYFQPYTDGSGIHIPTYQDYEDYLVAQARQIFGNDIYLEPDSQDFQLIAAQALTAYQTALTAQLAYNSRSPGTAVGTGLDGIIQINGLVRRGDTFSQATVTLLGEPYTAINNGIVGDVNGNRWALPPQIVLDEYGTVTVTATCETAGAITALVGQINVIVTPTFGWSSVNNPNPATPGRGQELDSELRARQAVSVANPSQALTTGILGSVLAVDGVVSAQLYENDTNLSVSEINGIYNPYDYPPHSITLVVDGGDSMEIANAIYIRKTPGCYTNGDVAETLTDRYGAPTTIRFFRPIEIPIQVEITIEALNGYTSTMATLIEQAISDYLNSLVAGQSVIISELWQAALSADPNSYPVFSITTVEAAFNYTGETPSTNNIIMDFDQKAICDPSYVTVIVT